MKAVRKRLAKKTTSVLVEKRFCGEIRNINGIIENNVSMYAWILVNLARTRMRMIIPSAASGLKLNALYHAFKIDYESVICPDPSGFNDSPYVE